MKIVKTVGPAREWTHNQPIDYDNNELLQSSLEKLAFPRPNRLSLGKVKSLDLGKVLKQFADDTKKGSDW